MRVRRRWHALAGPPIVVMVSLPLLPASADESGSPSSAPTSAQEETVFTVGITQDVDTTNPFTGIAGHPSRPIR